MLKPAHEGHDLARRSTSGRVGEASTWVRRPSATQALNDRLAALGIDYVDRGNVATAVAETAAHDDPHARYLPEILATCERIAGIVGEAVDDGSIPIVLGGDHSIALGTLSGLASRRGPGARTCYLQQRASLEPARDAGGQSRGGSHDPRCPRSRRTSVGCCRLFARGFLWCVRSAIRFLTPSCASSLICYRARPSKSCPKRAASPSSSRRRAAMELHVWDGA